MKKKKTREVELKRKPLYCAVSPPLRIFLVLFRDSFGPDFI